MSLYRNEYIKKRRFSAFMSDACRACLRRCCRYDALTFSMVLSMTEQFNAKPAGDEHASSLYGKLLGETAAISWHELQPFFARGVVLWVAAALDLIGVAQAVAEDDKARIGAWMAAGEVNLLQAAQAEDWLARDPSLWAVVVAPWVLVQERVAGVN